ncbi:hypothetical protein [Modestobacter italicus]|uniref:hypothetical protein n=1 Tax=Modestobacter italicus (strain DSM 44449 / CECT 9708 / BC 501) TaxID=2732864 RepID=UPI001C950798|nr:hypothetical protein [Modestobacter italicus]
MDTACAAGARGLDVAQTHSRPGRVGRRTCAGSPASRAGGAGGVTGTGRCR